MRPVKIPMPPGSRPPALGSKPPAFGTGSPTFGTGPSSTSTQFGGPLTRPDRSFSTSNVDDRRTSGGAAPSGGVIATLMETSIAREMRQRLDTSAGRMMSRLSSFGAGSAPRPFALPRKPKPEYQKFDEIEFPPEGGATSAPPEPVPWETVPWETVPIDATRAETPPLESFLGGTELATRFATVPGAAAVVFAVFTDVVGWEVPGGVETFRAVAEHVGQLASTAGVATTVTRFLGGLTGTSAAPKPADVVASAAEVAKGAGLADGLAVHAPQLVAALRAEDLVALAAVVAAILALIHETRQEGGEEQPAPEPGAPADPVDTLVELVQTIFRMLGHSGGALMDRVRTALGDLTAVPASGTGVGPGSPLVRPR